MVMLIKYVVDSWCLCKYDDSTSFVGPKDDR